MKECNLKRNTKNRGCLPKCKKVFFVVCLFCFLVVLFFVACVFVLLFCKKAQKGYFPANLEAFCLFLFPQKACFKMFLFFLFCVLSLFSLCLPFQNSIFFFAFCPSIFFLEKILCGGFFCLSFLSFPFLLFASFFERSFLASPFWSPSCFCFGHFFFCCFCFCLHGVCFCLFCFDVGFVIVMFLVCFAFGFVLFLVSLSGYVNVFSLQFQCFPHVGLKLDYFFSISCFCYCFFFSCVVCFQLKQLSCIILFLCCYFCNMIEWFLVCIFVVLS